MKRNDEHRPSEINPADYEFVGLEYLGSSSSEELANMMAGEYDNIEDHKHKTGGELSDHCHGGECHVCGACALLCPLVPLSQKWLS